jgi:pimeloyl-ACP methyl ester carboxylesterase
MRDLRLLPPTITALFALLACTPSGDATSDSTGALSGENGPVDATWHPGDCATFPYLVDTAKSANVPIDAALKQLGSIRCGYVDMPESRRAPSKNRVRLATVVVKANKPAGQPPITYLQGGPGQSALTMLLALAPGGLYAPLREDRDLVLINDRGNKYSEPTLACSELDTLGANIFRPGDPVAHPIDPQADLDARKRCYERLNKQYDLASYTTVDNAHDIADAMVALSRPSAAGGPIVDNADRYHLFGVSFGTRRVQRIARLIGDKAASIILDSPTALADNFMKATTLAPIDAVKQLFSACASDDGCNRAYPNLEERYVQKLTELDAQPVNVNVPDPSDPTGNKLVIDPTTQQPYTFPLTGARVYMSLAYGLLDAYKTEEFPMRAAEVADGNFAFVTTLVTSELFPGNDLNGGGYASAACAEGEHIGPGDLPALDPAVGPFVRPAVEKVLAQCTVWPVPKISSIDPAAFAPLESATLHGLLMSVRFDAHTRSANSQEMHEHLPSTFVRFWNDRPHVATAPPHGGSCAVQMIADFVKDPTKQPASKCFDDAKPTFLLPTGM